MKSLLMVAFHYPPYEGGSGVHRTLKFSRYLPQYGWRPIVLSADARAYPRTGKEQLCEIPAEAIIRRAFALDATRHLSIGGRYLRLSALPDQWANWWLCGVLKGFNLIRKFGPQAIWSTYPIATAHLIALTLHRLTGLPWIADFRDSMTEDNYPRDPWSRSFYLWIERRVVRHAAQLVFTAASARRMYMQRYQFLSADRCFLIPNGYDEEDFSAINSFRPMEIADGRPLRLVHAGLIYSDDRDPRAFFRALSRLKSVGIISARTLIIDLRASGSEDLYRKLLHEFEISDIVHLLPPLPYKEALRDCASADALLLFQAASCNHQIPAKLYEYLRLRKPILALTPREGDSGTLLNKIGGAIIVDINDEEAIYQAIPSFLDSVKQKTLPVPGLEIVERFSRKYQAAQLANCITAVTVKSQ